MDSNSEDERGYDPSTLREGIIGPHGANNAFRSTKRGFATNKILHYCVFFQCVMRQVPRLTSAVSFATALLPLAGCTSDQTSVCYTGRMPRGTEGV